MATRQVKKPSGTLNGAHKSTTDIEPETRKPRILVLTGTASGEKIMKIQMGKLYKKLEDKVTFVIHEGTIPCNSSEAVEIMSKFFKGLPMMMYDELMFDDRQWRCYRNVRETLASLQGVLQQKGPFDGVMGFSQGANFAIMLAAQAYACVGVPLRFCVAICPNAPGYADQVREYFRDPIRIPALIIRGEQERYDEGVQKTLLGLDIDIQNEPIVSNHAVKFFKDPEIFSHPDGHRILPADPKIQDQLVDKFTEFVMAKWQLDPEVRGPQEYNLPLWRVPNTSAQGRVVRKREGLASAEEIDTLRPGAIVEELELSGTRLHYFLLCGNGPQSGWVTTKTKNGGNWLVKAPGDAMGTTGEIWIATVGTRGDLQPFVVLAMALQKAGYRVRIFGPPELHTFSEASGISFTTVCGGWSERSVAAQTSRTMGEKRHEDEDQDMAQQDQEGKDSGDESDTEGQLKRDSSAPEPNMEEHKPTANVIEEPDIGWPMFLHLMHSLGVDIKNGGDVANLAWLWVQMPKAIAVVHEAMKAGKPDLLIYNHLMVNLGLLMWRLHGVRSIFANLGLEFHFGPRGEDSFNHKTLGAFDRHVVRPIYGEAPVATMSKEEYANLYNSSDRLLGTTKLIIHVLPPEDQKVAREWKFTGFWIYDESKQMDEPKAFGGKDELKKMQDFLDAGSRPVYMGWGSMPTLPGLMVSLVRALKTLRLRAVMVKGWGNLTLDCLRQEVSELQDGEELIKYAQDNILFAEKAPHEWLLPRCLCTVHHGGAGTTAAGLRAGVPTIIVPLGYDQPVHGDWVEKLGVGVKTSKMMEIKGEEFENALRKAVSDPEINRKASSVAESLKREPGVSAAVEKVRSIMRDDVRSGNAQARWEAGEPARQEARKKFFERNEKQQEIRRRREEARRQEEIRRLDAEKRQYEELKRIEEEERREQEQLERQREEEAKRQEEEMKKAEERRIQEEKQREQARKMAEEERKRVEAERERADAERIRIEREQEEEERKLEEARRLKRKEEEEQKKREAAHRLEEERKMQEQRRQQEENGQQDKSNLEHFSTLEVFIDRGLELKVTFGLEPGMTIWTIKERLAQDDPTGMTKPSDVSLMDPASHTVLSDSTMVYGTFTELDVAL